MSGAVDGWAVTRSTGGRYAATDGTPAPDIGPHLAGFGPMGGPHRPAARATGSMAGNRERGGT